MICCTFFFFLSLCFCDKKDTRTKKKKWKCQHRLFPGGKTAILQFYNKICWRIQREKRRCYQRMCFCLLCCQIRFPSVVLATDVLFSYPPFRVGYLFFCNADIWEHRTNCWAYLGLKYERFVFGRARNSEVSPKTTEASGDQRAMAINYTPL